MEYKHPKDYCWYYVDKTHANRAVTFKQIVFSVYFTTTKRKEKEEEKKKLCYDMYIIFNCITPNCICLPHLQLSFTVLFL